MAFSQQTINSAWNQAGGKCERCKKALDPQNSKVGMRWHAHHKTSQDASGSDGASNCEILCVNCHKNTQSYGGN